MHRKQAWTPATELCSDRPAVSWASRALLTVLLGMAAPAPAVAAVGDLDPAFGIGGVALLNGQDAPFTSPVGPIVQADGKIVSCAVGLASDGSPEPAALYRLNRDGSTDTSFGSDGRVDIGPSIAGSICYSLVSGPDGDLIVAGRRLDPSSTATPVLRLHADGTPDANFGEAGVSSIANGDGATGTGQPLAVQADGGVLLGGGLYPNAFGVTRVDQHGVLDTTFGSAGQARIEFPDTDVLQTDVNGLAVDAAGRIVVVGVLVDESTFVTDFAVVRLLPNGSPDLTFGDAGRVDISVDRVNAYPFVTLIDGSGRIILAGFSGTAVGTTAPTGDIVVVRLFDNGALDTNFGQDGTALIAIDAQPGAVDAALAGVLTADSKILLAGFAADGTVDHALVVRLDENGQGDGQFGHDGVRTFDPIVGGGLSAHFVGLAAQGSDFIVLGTVGNGSDFHESFVSRLEGNRASVLGHSRHRRPPPPALPANPAAARGTLIYAHE